MSVITTPITEMFGIKHPILLAGACVRDHVLVRAECLMQSCLHMVSALLCIVNLDCGPCSNGRDNISFVAWCISDDGHGEQA